MHNILWINCHRNDNISEKGQGRHVKYEVMIVPSHTEKGLKPMILPFNCHLFPNAKERLTSLGGIITI